MLRCAVRFAFFFEFLQTSQQYDIHHEYTYELLETVAQVAQFLVAVAGIASS